MRRQHMQVYLSEQLIQKQPADYVFFTQNAADGENSVSSPKASIGSASTGRFQAAARCCTRATWRGRRIRIPGDRCRAQPFAPNYEAIAGPCKYTDTVRPVRAAGTPTPLAALYYSSDCADSRSYHLENCASAIGTTAGLPASGCANLSTERYALKWFLPSADSSLNYPKPGVP